MIQEIGGTSFNYVCEIIPESENGVPIEHMPQFRYKNIKNNNLNKYGRGPFCKFKISKNHKSRSGVYVLRVDKKPVYVGECLDLEGRYNTGYGNISPKNCYDGGQPTNCRINSLILGSVKNGAKIDLLFHETANRIELEKILIQKLRPSWNLEYAISRNIL